MDDPGGNADGPARGARAAWLALLVAPLLLVGPALLPGRRFLPQLAVGLPPLAAEYPERAAAAWEDANYSTSDRVFPFLTDQLEARRQLAAGSLPTWEPKLGLGLPLFGGSLAALAYPPNWLALALPPDLAAGWLALSCLLLAGAGTGLFLARLGLAPLAALFGALAVQVGGWGVANLPYPMKVDAAVWLPWSLWAVEGLVRGRRGAGFALCAFTGLSFTAGFVPIAVFCTGAAALYGAGRMLAARVGAAEEDLPLPRVARLVRLGVLLALGVGAAGVQLLPTVEASRESVRQDRSAADLRAESLPACTLLGLGVAHLFGSPREPVARGDAAALWLAGDAADAERALASNALEWNGFAGAAVLVLSAAALVGRPRRALAPALLVALAWCFALGWAPARWAYALPGFNFGAPARALAVTWLAWPWLAAVGLDALVAGRRAAWSVALGLAVAGAVAALALAARFEPDAWARELPAELARRHGRPVVEARAALAPLDAPAAGRRVEREVFASGFALAAAAAAAALAHGLRRRGAGPQLACAPLALVALVEGGWHAPEHLAPRRVEGAERFPPSEAIDAVARAAGDGRVLRLDESTSGVADVLRLARPNMLAPYGVGDLTPFVVFTPRRLVELMEALHPGTRYLSGVSRLPVLERVAHPILDLARVGAVLATRRLEHPRLEPVLEREGFCVYRRTGLPPLARVVPRAVETASDRAALELLATGAVEPSEAVLLAPGHAAGGGVDAGDDGGAPHRPGRIEWLRSAPNRLDFRIHDTSGGWLVVHEQYYPGWKATVDGEDARIVRADHALRAIRIPAGDVVGVRTKYEPWSLRLGATLTVASLAAAGWLGRRRRRRSARR